MRGNKYLLNFNYHFTSPPRILINPSLFPFPSLFIIPKQIKGKETKEEKFHITRNNLNKQRAGLGTKGKLPSISKACPQSKGELEIVRGEEGEKGAGGEDNSIYNTTRVLARFFSLEGMIQAMASRVYRHLVERRVSITRDYYATCFSSLSDCARRSKLVSSSRDIKWRAVCTRGGRPPLDARRFQPYLSRNEREKFLFKYLRTCRTPERTLAARNSIRIRIMAA